MFKKNFNKGACYGYKDKTSDGNKVRFDHQENTATDKTNGAPYRGHSNTLIRKKSASQMRGTFLTGAV